MNTLFARSVITLVAILVGVCVAFVAISWWTTDRYHQEVTQRLNRTIADYIVAEQELIGEQGINQDALKHIAHMVMVINPTIEVYLLDPTGEVVGHALPEGAIADPLVSLAPIESFLHNPDRLPIYGEDPRHPQSKKVFSAAPVTDVDGKTLGYLYAVLGGEKHVSAVRGMRNSLIFKVSMMSVVALMTFAVLAGLFIFYLLTRRLKSLVKSFEQFRNSGFSEVVPAVHRTKNGDEIDGLATTFNDMSRKIVSQMHELKQTDLRRRELIQNVSHDLRTPLASMQGYIDTLYLKYHELDDEQKRDYLKIAGRHGRSLSKLVKELFELANLDAGTIKLKQEQFPMSELVQDIIQKFRLDAAKLGVSLEIDFEKSDSMVSADIGLLERVLENLIDNALRHTAANGYVRVTLTTDQQSLVTTVIDSGTGISNEDLPRIFERTFVSKSDHPNRQQGTGLGLAIVKKILDLHGSQIQVASKIGNGSAFSFALRRS